MNIGTIDDTELSGSAWPRRPHLGEIEEDFASTLTPGDTFLIGGQVVRFEGLREMTVEVTRRPRRTARVAASAAASSRPPSLLTHRILALLAEPAAWTELPRHSRDWLALQAGSPASPAPAALLVETFPAEERCATFWGFAGQNAHQTLGLLLTHRMEAPASTPRASSPPTTPS